MSRIKELRISQGKSQQDLAIAAGVSRQAIGKIESGLSRPGGDVLVRLAAELGVSSAYLLGMTDDRKRDEKLPPDWEQLVEEAIADGLTPEEVRRAIKTLKVALGKAEQGK